MTNLIETINSTVITCFGQPLPFENKMRLVAGQTLVRMGIRVDSGKRTEYADPDNIGHWGVDVHYQIGMKLIGHNNCPIILSVAHASDLWMFACATKGTVEELETFVRTYSNESDLKELN